MDPLTIQNHLRSLSGAGQLPGGPELGPFVGPQRPPEVEGPSFQETLGQYLNEVNDQLVNADQQAAALASGRSSDVQGTVLAIQKADMQLRMLVETRNKVVRAYEEVMRMQA